MEKDSPRPQINASKLRVGGEIAGAIFTIGSMLIFLTGIPALRYIFPAAIVLGCMVALVLRFVRHDNPGASWLLAASEEKEELPPVHGRSKTSGRSTRIVIVPIASHT